MQTANDSDRLPRPATSPYDTWTRPSPTAPATQTPVEIVTPASKSSRQWFRPLRSEMGRWAIILAIWIPVVIGLLISSLFGAIYWQSREDQTRPVDAIVVLGAAQYDGRPTPVLQARLDKALALYRDGIAPLIIVTGGQQAGDRFTEAGASRDFLVSEGVPERAILLENEGRSSWESMESASLLLNQRGVKRIMLVSDGFHLFRLKVMARHQGLIPFAAPATDSPIEQGSRLEFHYMVREGGAVIAFLWQHGF